MPLSPADLSTLSRLLDEAMDLPPEKAQAWLDALPNEQTRFRSRLREMLAEHGKENASTFLAGGPKLNEHPDGTVANPGDRIGPYRLLREIGRGGMGAVWLAERVDGGGLRRQVALKLPRLAWGAGLAERMARERDIGALLEHPNIARLYDAGVDEKGRPYLALEYIEGVALDEWSRTRAPAIRERLHLFLQIARAVAYAHGRLVVHRDLKPSNVLVTADGQAHLLDFGIAKLLHEAGPGAELTQEQGRVFTPHYASPEQIRGETITVASDVYSLGVLLYELLSGRRPFDLQRRSLASLEEAVLGGDVPPASSRATTRERAGQLRGELDAILGKALQTSAAQRYATADAFAADIERQLGGERVLAQPDTLAYRMRKTLRRHRAAFAAAGAVLLAVLGGAGVSAVQARRASDAAERARVVKEFVVDVFKVNSRSDPGNSELRRLPVEVLLQRGANLIEAKFAGRPELQGELYGVVAGVFSDMGLHREGALYAARRVETLAAYDADASLRAAALLLLARELADDERLADAEARASRALALAAGDRASVVEAETLLARIHLRQFRLDDSERNLSRAENELSRDPSLPATLRVDAMAERANWLSQRNRFDEALPVYEQAIARALAGEGALSARASKLRITLAYALASRGRSPEGIPHAKAAFSEMRRLAGADDFATGVLEANLASYMLMNGGVKFEDARDAIARVSAGLDRSAIAVPDVVKARVQFQLGDAYLSWGDAVTAYRLMAPAFAILRPEARDPMSVFFLVAPMAMVAMDSGHHVEAKTLLAERLAFEKVPDRARQPFSVYGYVFAAQNASMQGHWAEARAILDAAPMPQDIVGAAGTRPSTYRDVLQLAKAELELARGQPARAIALLPDADPGASSPESMPQLLVRGSALCQLDRADEGFHLLSQGIEGLRRDRYAYDASVARWRTVAALCGLRLGRRAEAVALAESAREAFVKQAEVSPYYKALLPELERRLGAK